MEHEYNYAVVVCCFILTFSLKKTHIHLYCTVQCHLILGLVLEMKIWNRWSESNTWIYFYIVLNRNKNNVLVRTELYLSLAGGPVLIVMTVMTLCVLSRSHTTLQNLICLFMLEGSYYQIFKVFYMSLHVVCVKDKWPVVIQY